MSEPKTYVEYDGDRFSVHTGYDVGLRRKVGPYMPETRCPARVYSPLGNGHSVAGQCSNKGSLECGGYKFCKTHYPPNVVAKRKDREQKRKAKWDAESEHWKKVSARNALLQRCFLAIQQIAAGHNDPRALATETLAEPKPEGLAAGGEQGIAAGDEPLPSPPRLG